MAKIHSTPIGNRYEAMGHDRLIEKPDAVSSDGVHRLMKCIIYKCLLFSLVCFVLYGTAGFAQDNTCPFLEGESEYCDDSWHGLSALTSFLRETERKIEYHSELEISSLYSDNSDAVYLWIQPPEIDFEVIQQAIQNGARFLVLDETETSIQWFRMYYSYHVVMKDSPADPAAAHINQRDELPVLNVSQIQRYTSALNKENLQVALNHPTPLVWQEQDEEQICYAWSWPVSGVPDLWVIRDESFVRRIMLNTLDNRKYIHDVLNLLCPDNRCTIHIFEPGFVIHQNEDTGVVEPQESRTDKGREKFAQFIDSKTNQIKNRVDDYETVFSDNQWKLIVTMTLLIWLIIIVFTTITIKRGTGES